MQTTTETTMPNRRKWPTEKQIDEAKRVLRAEYYRSIRSYAEDIAGDAARGDLADAEAIDQRIHEVADGSGWVIYTQHALQVLTASDNWAAVEDEMGDAGGDSLVDIVTRAAYFAVRADIRELLANDYTCPRQDGHPLAACGRCGWCKARALLTGEEG